MEPHLIAHTPPRELRSSAAAAAGMWLRLGFLGGVGIAALAIAQLVSGEASLPLAVAASIGGSALAAFSLRRVWRLLIVDEPVDATAAPRPSLDRITLANS
jgi:hypothetical protein